MDTLAPRSGYELAAKILETHPNDAIETMLKYSNGAECDWLEFKAGMTLLPEDVRKGDKPDDLYWDYVLSIVAMANTRGGAFVIGVNDKTHKAVSLSSCDPRHVLEIEGKEGYLRKEVLDRIDRRDRAWTTKDGTIWSLDESIAPHVEGRFVPFDGNDVLVLLVKPVDIGKELFVGQKIKNGDVFESLPFRHLGEAGKVKRLTKRADWENYSRTREITSGQFGTWWDELDAESAASKEQAKIEEAITEYYQRQTKKAQQLMAVFTPLDAEENVFNSDDADLFYSPEAIETIESDDWLGDDDDEDGQESGEREDASEEDGFEDDADDGYGAESETDEEDLEDSESRSREARKGSLLELLNAEPRVIVSGEPGGGKTTCLTYYTLQHAKADGTHRILAVFIPMGQWRRGGSLSLMMERATEMDAGQLAHLMSENRLRLVIDAVNECPDDFRVAAIQNIGMFLAEHPTVPAVISTRHPKELAAFHLPVFHVQPMDETHRLRYLERYLQNGEQARKLLHQLGGMPGGETVAENPMLLRLVVEVYKESPEKRLPNGRAGLYRRSLRAWYKRENEKAERAGTKLQWSRRQTFELLAVLAFKSRQRGYRDVPREEILAIWGADAENQLEVLCQGPIIYCDEEFVRFRHETFQEYLCAEYLIAHQDELPSWTQADYAQWGMPFAYAVELFELDKQQLPESFWLAAWSLNPWLGVALTDERKGHQLLDPKYHGVRPMVEGAPLDMRSRTPYLKAVCGTFDEWTLRHALREDTAPWYKHGDVALRYVIFVSRACQSRWNNFEKSQLYCIKGLWNKHAVKLSKSWLTLDNPREIFQSYAPEEWHGWIESPSPYKAESLVNAKIALPEDFCEYKGRWNSEMGLGVALRLLSRRVLDLHDIEGMLPTLLEKAEVSAVAELIDIGYGDNALVVQKVQQWISEATPSSAIELIANGLATKDTFISHLSEWLKGVSIPSACQLVRIGLASKANFENKLQVWASFATPEMAVELIEVGMMSPLDFSDRLLGWSQHPQYSFIQKYLTISAEFDIVKRNAGLIRKWIAAASIDSAALLVEDGLATIEDFENKKYEWLAFLDGPQRRKVLESHLIKQRDFADFENLLTLIRQTCWDVKRGLRSPSDLTFEKDIWIKSANFSEIMRLVHVGILTKKDIAGQIEIWINNSTPELALCLVKQHLADAKDFTERLSFWKNLIEPDIAIELIKDNIIGEEDILDVKERWRASIDPTKLGSAIQLGYITLDEAVDYLEVWGDAIPDDVNRYVRTMIAIDRISIGQVVCGKVRNITELGAFIDFDSIYGSLHINDMSWGRVKHPSELLEVGQDVKVKVIGVDHATGRISLSLKQMTADPWTGIAQKFPVGSRVTGKVVNLAAYGAFIELEEGIDGMVHVSEMSWTRKINRPSECLQVGQVVEAVVLHIDSEKQRIELSLKQAQRNPFPGLIEKYKVGTIVNGKVKGIASFGAFIELEEGIDGLVHISQISECPIGKVKDILQVGQEVEARVVKVDSEAFRIGLSMRAVSMSDDEFSSLVEELNAAGNVQPSDGLDGTDEGRRVFRQQDLIDKSVRQQIERILGNARWDMQVQYLSEDRGYLFFAHPSFPDNVYCPARSTKYQDVFDVGQTWNVCVDINQNMKDGTWGFIARSVEPSKQNTVCATRREKSTPLNASEQSKTVTTSVPPVNATRKPLLQKPVVVSGSNGCAEVEKRNPSFSHASHLSIYIDETWPGTQDHAYKDVGVIGGIVVPWEGIDEKRLPVLKTHLSNGSVARSAIQAMLAESDVFPFVFPIKWDRAVSSGGRQYFELVQHALMLLLGWMLPQRDRLTTVDIHLEHIAGFENGHDETDFINSLTQAMRLLSGGRRFANWQIRRVEWVDKEFGYVPYGDLVCKTCVPHEEQQMLARAVKVREWEGYLPFSKGIFPLLRDMDTASPSGFADLLIAFAKVAEDTPFFRHVRKLAIQRAQSDTTFRDAVFSRFEACYTQPDRDISLLNRVVPHFLEEFPPDLFKDRPRMQLLRILIAFQHANHNGDPDLVSALVGEYQSLRPRVLELDRDLCAYADLNLAVHEHDAFEFDNALALVDGWISAPLFPALSVMNRGRMFSSRGQSLALMGRNQEADEAFAQALAQFAAEPELLAKDIEQTKTYQAMNALDQDAPSAVPLLEGLLGKTLLVAALNFMEVLDKPFVAHLFLKALWRMRTERSVVLDALLKNLPAEIAIRGQHPYELILFYLALLTKDANPAYAQARAEELEQFFETIEFGGTLGLIHAYIRVMLKSYGFGVVSDQAFLDELGIVEQYLPKADTIINKLRLGWADSSMSVEGVLPFNYC